MAAGKEAQNKLQILYLVKNAPGVSYHLLMDRCLSGLLMDFFTFSEVYGQLISGDLINKTIEDTGTGEVIGMNETLRITEGGEAVLSDLIVTLNPQMKTNLDSMAEELFEQTKKINSIKAFIDPAEDGRFIVSLQAVNTSLKITVKDRETADRLCGNWRLLGSEKEKAIIDELLK